MNLSDVREKKILISCLNWGMGHVSRCIGLIQKLEKQGNTCVVAGNEAQLAVFKTYFPLIETINHEGYPFNFSNEISVEISSDNSVSEVEFSKIGSTNRVGSSAE